MKGVSDLISTLPYSQKIWPLAKMMFNMDYFFQGDVYDLGNTRLPLGIWEACFLVPNTEGAQAQRFRRHANFYRRDGDVQRNHTSKNV